MDSRTAPRCAGGRRTIRSGSGTRSFVTSTSGSRSPTSACSICPRGSPGRSGASGVEPISSSTASTPTWRPRHGDRLAVIWEGEDGTVRRWTYGRLNSETCRLAGALRGLGLGRGDVVAIYLPMIPETVAAYLAIAKIGAVVLPMFSGFGAAAAADRMRAAGARAVVTADGTRRRGRRVAMKPVIDAAATHTPALRHVIMLELSGIEVDWNASRDRNWHEIAANVPETEPDRDRGRRGSGHDHVYLRDHRPAQGHHPHPLRRAREERARHGTVRRSRSRRSTAVDERHRLDGRAEDDRRRNPPRRNADPRRRCARLPGYRTHLAALRGSSRHHARYFTDDRTHSDDAWGSSPSRGTISPACD